MIKNAEDIISLPIEINDRMADSKFRLVHIASQRVRETVAGDRPLVHRGPSRTRRSPSRRAFSAPTRSPSARRRRWPRRK